MSRLIPTSTEGKLVVIEEVDGKFVISCNGGQRRFNYALDDGNQLQQGHKVRRRVGARPYNRGGGRKRLFGIPISEYSSIPISPSWKVLNMNRTDDERAEDIDEYISELFREAKKETHTQYKDDRVLATKLSKIVSSSDTFSKMEYIHCMFEVDGDVQSPLNFIVDMSNYLCDSFAGANSILRVYSSLSRCSLQITVPWSAQTDEGSAAEKKKLQAEDPNPRLSL